MIDRLRDESGIGIPLAMGVLLLVLILAAWSVSSADQLHRSSERDRSAKQALGPADAGIQRAAWRLGQSTVAATQCVVSNATGESVVAPVAGECPLPAATTSMGDGSAYSYVVSPQHTAAGTCAGQATVAGDRCATATGTSRGVARRVQVILRRPMVDILYTHRGMIGKEWLKTGNNVNGVVCAGEASAEVGSNGTIAFGGSNVLNASGCGGNGAFSVFASAVTGSAAGAPPTQVKNPPYELPPVQIPPPPYANGSITGSGFSWEGGFAQRNLLVSGNVHFGAGTYNFCQLVQSNGTISVTPGELVKIYIDSPDRSGSGCDTGTGGFWIQNNVEMNWGAPGDLTAVEPAERAPWLQIFVYGSAAWENGTRPCNGNKSGAVLICNASKFAGTIYAPNSKVVVSNQSQVVGAISAKQLELENGVRFRVPSGLLNQVVGQEQGAAAPARWTECRSAAPAAADPESGCG